MHCLFSYAYSQLKPKFLRLIYDEKGAVDIVAVAVLIGIAVVLAVLFRTQIESVLNSLFSTIGNKAQEAVK